MVTHYRFFGLQLKCELPLPLPPIPSPPDVPAADLTLMFEAHTAPLACPPSKMTVRFHAGPDAWTYRLEGARGHWFSMNLSDGAMEIASDFPWDVAAAHAMGVGARLTLARRQIVALHGGAISIDGVGVVILGPSGFGKSSLVAAMVRQGAALLSEELVVFRRWDNGFAVEPGPARLSLSGAGADFLLPGLRQAAMPRYGNKYWLPVDALSGGYSPEQVRLAAVVVLSAPKCSGDGMRLERLSPATAHVSMLSNLHAHPAQPPRRQALPLLADIAGRVAAFRLHRPWSLEGLADVARHVLSEVPR